MKPIGDHVLVMPIPADDTIAGPDGTLTLVIPDNDSSREKPNRGLVVSVGEGRYMPDGSLRPINLVKDQKVLFSKYAGNEFPVDQKTYIVLSYDDILILLD